MTLLKYIFNASLSEGPSESINDEIWMSTYDVVTLKVGKGEEKNDISVLPDGAAVKFFCITSDQYGEKGNTDPNKMIKYIIQSKASTPTDIPIVLDRPHVLIGKEILDNVGNFSVLKIKNDTQSEANIKIVFGRDIPTP
jgi:hypothetical protein